MSSRENPAFRLARTVMSASSSLEEVRTWASLLEDPVFCRRVSAALRVLDSALQNPMVSAPLEHRDSAAAPRDLPKSSELLLLQKLEAILRQRGIGPSDLQKLVRRVFKIDIPVSRRGLNRYLRRLQRQHLLYDLHALLTESSSAGDPQAMEDPWVREMLAHARRR